VGARLAQRLACQVGYLVAADDHCLGVLGGHGTGLGQRQALRDGGWSLTGQRGFINVRGNNIKIQVQALQQFAPVAGSGAQHQGAVGLRGERSVHGRIVGIFWAASVLRYRCTS